MNRKELYEMFNYGDVEDVGPVEIDEAECIRLSYIANNSGKDILLNLIPRYKSSYSREGIRFFIETVTMIVDNPKMAGFSLSPISLISLVMNSFGASYFDVMDCFEKLSEAEGMARKVFLPMIYGLSFKCSQLDATSNIANYTSALEALTSLHGVLEELKNEVYWGLGDSGLGGDIVFDFPIYYGFPCRFPCILDGFFEPFIYKKCDYSSPAREYLGISMREVVEKSRRSYHALSDHSYKMHQIIYSIIRSSKELKTNFMRYVCNVISASKERSKTIFNWKETISDGFAYNLSMVMSRFNRKIIDGNMIDKINPESVEEVSLESFPTFCYFSKIHLLFTSCVKFGEYIRSLAYEYRLLEGDGGERVEAYRKGIDSKISALNGLLFMTDFFADEKAFTDFMTEYTAEIEYPWTDNYYRTLLWMQEMTIDLIKSATISGSLNKVMETIMDWRSPMFKKEVVKILSHRSDSIKFTMLNRVIDYYNSLGRDEMRMEARSIVHSIFKEGRVFSRMNVCKRNITFINCMMKDFEYSLSEGLSSIKDIKEDTKTVEDLTKELEEVKKKNLDAKKAESISERIGSIKKSIRFSKNKARNSFLYVDGCFDLFMHILDEKPDLFLVNEMISNFVRVLNCNLKVITGPRCTDLVIRSPEQYGFDAKNLLRRMVMIYIKIRSNKFVEMVASDKMYFDIEFFRTALRICESKYLINESQMEELRNLISKLEKVEVIEKTECVPDEFIDPLTFNPIRNPVKLLTSKITVDRSTYDMLMMNGGIDPFNRMPLTEDMVIEDIDLKERIDKYYGCSDKDEKT
ncbi:ubiquitin fusion degradation protein 2 [Encephalitozoon hellem ATCC 50504]|uniref:Ubiquitin conjugation factor E4 n=1 Tax=Encephalitozoon hellem TaxID=27973 RepID=A0A9Q9C7U0_ENCHE|nr:ubiquitin fusion degradation protein 2 [Encephalitozoon hellem ATCC 50504]AFM98164.1 ubiquitin fusion degradation protein 2 [Encephalitozoon hellem ATCC 50504]UTX43010.1 ubiquitin conjugation factor E4 [Encephalitozoon hellem]WEL38467.1 ubiquitin fusion degradation protein 2 [Encephalitozoon hellem]|eukprot:XP_003887145.1 ubiquitin fusion degradation protein 2 [Encephalitozoon hellem ATCC 50504]